MLKADKKALGQEVTRIVCDEEVGVVTLDTFYLHESLVDDYLLRVVPSLVDTLLSAFGVNEAPKVIVTVGTVETSVDYTGLDSEEGEPE